MAASIPPITVVPRIRTKIQIWIAAKRCQLVIELLKSTAAAHPGVAKEPSPQVYVANFSAGAVTLQLRAWTDRHEDWAQLRSDLSDSVEFIEGWSLK